MAQEISPLSRISQNIADGGQLRLDQSTLGTDCDLSLFSGLLPQQACELTGCRSQPVSAEGTLIVSGVLSFFLSWRNVPVTVLLWDHPKNQSAERQAVIRVEIPPDTTVETYLSEYPAGADVNAVTSGTAETMVDLYLSKLSFGKKAMIFSSLDYVEGFDQIYPADFNQVLSATEIRKGLNFPLKINIEREFSDYINTIFGDPLAANDIGYGLVYRLESTPYFFAGKTFNAQLDLGPLKLKLKLKRFGLGFALVDDGKIWPQVLVNGSVDIGGKSLVVEADYDLYHKFLALNFCGFPTLGTLLSKLRDADQYFPAPLDALLGIRLSKLKLIFDLNSKSVAEISLIVTTEQDIDLIEKIVSIKPTLELQIFEPFDAKARSLGGTLKGIWQLGSTNFETTLTYPTLDLYAAMAKGQTLDIDALAEKVFGMSLPEIKITAMELEGNFKNKSFAIHLTIESDWKIKLVGNKNLVLKQVQMGMRYADQQREYEAACVLKLAGVDLDISARYVSKGWQFTGSAQNIEIGKLVEWINGKCVGDKEEDVTLPEALTSLTIENLTLEFHTKSQFIQFTCDGKFKLSDDDKEEAEATITITRQAVVEGKQSGDVSAGLAAKDDAKKGSKKEKKDGKSSSFEFGGHLTLGDKEFELCVSKDGEAGQTNLVATYKEDPAKEIKLRDLVGKISKDVVDMVPESLAIKVRDVYFAYYKEGGGKQEAAINVKPKKGAPPAGPAIGTSVFSGFLLGADLKAAVQLSDIPLAGESLPANLQAGVENLRMVLASAAFRASQLEGINQDLETAGIPKLAPPKEPAGAGTAGGHERPDVVVQKGLSLSAELKLGDYTRSISLTTARSKPSQPAKVAGKKSPKDSSAEPAAISRGVVAVTETPPGTAEKPSTAKSDGGGTWLTLDKKLGPVDFHRIGLQYQNRALWVLLDVAFSSSGLTLSLDGLAVGSSLSEFKPKFKLDGIGLDYKKSGVEIGGAFLHEKLPPIGNKSVDQYSGVALIKTKALTLSAIGSYAEVDGYTSMFVYAFLDKPLGGPTFFFVTGLAAGFGYNRNLISPKEVEEIESFPLVSIAMGSNPVGDTKDQTSALLDILKSLGSYVPPAPNKYFLALGIKFNSFKLIDSFALLVITFGDEFRLKLLGLSKIAAPPAKSGKTPVAEVTIGLIAEFAPDEGLLRVEGKIMPGSYVLSHACQISGGFAFYSWFSGPHDGDFVLSVGGYHPRFKVPAHYPAIDRLALNWQIDPHLSVKGSTYFALTSSAVMAGGHLEARLDKGDLQAWFDLSTDFLISWQPFYYDISLSIEIGVSFDTGLGIVRASLGAGVHIWGPEFAGTAHVTLIFVSFDVEFGAKGIQQPPALTWPEFKTSFLPPDKDVCTIAVKDGLARTKKTAAEEERWIINPKEFALSIDSVIPVKATTGELNGFPSGKSDKQLGIGSMDVKEFESILTITATRGAKKDNCLDKFQFAEVRKSVPSALWGKKRQPDLNGKPIPDVLCGLEVRPAGHPDPGDTNDIKCSVLRYNPENLTAISWQSPKPAKKEPANKAKIEGSLNGAQGKLGAFFPNDADDPFDTSLDHHLIAEFLELPQLTSH